MPPCGRMWIRFKDFIFRITLNMLKNGFVTLMTELRNSVTPNSSNLYLGRLPLKLCLKNGQNVFPNSEIPIISESGLSLANVVSLVLYSLAALLTLTFIKSILFKPEKKKASS